MCKNEKGRSRYPLCFRLMDSSSETITFGQSCGSGGGRHLRAICFGLVGGRARQVVALAYSIDKLSASSGADLRVVSTDKLTDLACVLFLWPPPKFECSMGLRGILCRLWSLDWWLRLILIYFQVCGSHCGSSRCSVCLLARLRIGWAKVHLQRE